MILGGRRAREQKAGRRDSLTDGGDAHSLARAELRPGETLIWWDRPDPGALARKALPKAIFGIFFTGFALFWESQVLKGLPEGGGVAWFLALWGIPFIAVGLGLLVSPLWRHWKARRTLYLLTDRRAVIIDGGTRSFGPGDLGDLSRRERADGSGNIIFGGEESGRSRRGRRQRHGFYGIAGVRQVEQALLDLKMGRRPDPGAAPTDVTDPPLSSGRIPGGER